MRAKRLLKLPIIIPLLALKIQAFGLRFWFLLASFSTILIQHSKEKSDVSLFGV